MICGRNANARGLPRKAGSALHLSPETLAGIEANTVGKLTLGILFRIAHSLGKQIACSLSETVA